MTTTDTDALTERLSEAVRETLMDDHGAGSDLAYVSWDGEQWLAVEGGIDLPHLIAVVLPIVDEEVRKAKAEALREALDGLIADKAHTKALLRAENGGNVEDVLAHFRDTHYPEETPVTAQPTRDQLRALADQATEGPWEADHSEEDNSSVKQHGREWGDGFAFAGRPDDAEFIAAARNAIPQLLDRLDQAEHRIARLEAQTDIRGRAVVIYRERARVAEARIEAVRDVLELHGPAHDEPGQDEADCGPQIIADIRRALDGDA